MTKNDNLIVSNSSYTEKDFNSIYVELLDLVKELTYKWNPSISNESDPGVILLKLNALIADKCNYNIDKNVLECFPLSVTQESNARQLFEQLGYYMKWFRSAYSTISMKWIGDNSNYSYTIPAFTMVSDYNNEIIYTLVGPNENVAETEFNVGSQKLSCDGNILTWKAIQGIAVNYDINGETLITSNILDSNNRIYFSDTDVAENGIFICNAGQNNYSSWQRKDNLLVETLGNTYYKFGITQDGNNCYIEFPEDAETIFREGINITYIKTNGVNGNVAAQTIEKFYNDITPIEDSNIILSTENVKIINYSSIRNGFDKETIDEGYNGYKHIVGTFDTLVTLRDYLNAIYKSGLVSNGFVCDRNNDIQSSYKIMTLENDINQRINVVLKKEDIDDEEKEILDKYGLSVDEMNAFSLKLYLLQYVEDMTTIDGFNESFEMLKPSNSQNSDEYETVKNYIDNEKTINHDYVDILPLNTINSHLCYFVNQYPIKCKIIPNYALTITQSSEVSENIKQALFENFNSKKLSFGEQITIDDIYYVIKSADSRIKNVILDNIIFTTYAVYYDGTDFKKVDISSKDIEPVVINTNFSGDLVVNPISKNVVPKGTKFYSDRELLDYVASTTEDTDVINTYNTFATISVSDTIYYVDLSSVYAQYKFIDVVGKINYDTYKFIYDGTNWTLNSENINLDDYGIEILSGSPELSDEMNVHISIKTQIQNEIFAKSVLNGTTQLFIEDEKFDFKVDQITINTIVQEGSTNIETGKVIDNIKSIKGTTNITLSTISQTTLKENEILQLIAPNLLDVTTYSNYVKFEYNGNKVNKNASYTLSDNEWLILYWKNSDEDILYNYIVYGKGNIISPTFDLESTGSLVGQSLTLLAKKDEEGKLIASTQITGEMSSSLSAQIENISAKTQILSGLKKITIKKINSIELNENSYCYWITNRKEKDKYYLFDDNEQKKVLTAGEYFIYSNSSLTDLNILGAGTSITRSVESASSDFVVDVVDTSSILTDGVAALSGYWFSSTTEFTLTITEDQFINLPSKSVIKLTLKTLDVAPSITIGDNYVSLADYDLYYKLPSSDTFVKLDEVDLGGSSVSGWEAKAILSINISKETPQVLYLNQNITYKTLDNVEQTIYGTNQITIQQTNSNMTFTINPIVLYTSNNLINSSGYNFSTLSQDEYGSYHYVSLYLISEVIKQSSSDENIICNYDTAGNLTIKIKNANTGTTVIPILTGLPSGKYIFPVKVGNDDIDVVQMSISNQIWKEIFSDITNINKQGLHYMDADYTIMNNSQQDNLSMTTVSLTLTNYPANTIITIGNVYKYTIPNGMTEEQFSSIVAELRRLDKENLFDYTYKVDENLNIPNPLDSSSFNLSNHIYNPFTICKLDTTENTIISIINN